MKARVLPVFALIEAKLNVTSALVPKSASVADNTWTKVPMLEDSDTWAVMVLAANCGKLSLSSVIVISNSAVVVRRKEVYTRY